MTPEALARVLFDRVMDDFELHRALGHSHRKGRVRGCTACVLTKPEPPRDRRTDDELAIATAGALTQVPAHSRPLPERKCRCGRKATVEVFNTRNASFGFFCGPCGRRKVTELNAEPPPPPYLP